MKLKETIYRKLTLIASQKKEDKKMIFRWRKVIRCMIILGIIFMGEHPLLPGQMGQIKVVGKIVIPTASGEKAYKAVIKITQEEITIECRKKIFQLFNEFNTPWYQNLKVKTSEISNIKVSKNEIYLISEANFYQRYRHLFHQVEKILRFFPYKSEMKNAIIFIMDNPADIGDREKKSIEYINKKQKK